MFRTLAGTFTLLALCANLHVFAQDSAPQNSPAPSGDFAIENPLAKKVPSDVILVKGAAPGSNDPSIPVPEAGSIENNVYSNKYFSLSYSLPPGFAQKFIGPPPSDSGYYVLTQLEPTPQFEASAAGSVLVSAQDLFFGLIPASSPRELINFRRERLGPDFKIEKQPTEVKLGNHSFIRFDYMSPAAELHWYTLATEVRCHAVVFQFTSRDPELLESMVRQMDKVGLLGQSSPGATAPACVKNYASGENVLRRVEPVFTDHKFNRIPVRIIIDKYGKVKYIHVISAFPSQIKAINDALSHWEFRPYRVNGKPVEVETGIMFGRQPRPGNAATSTARVSD